MAVGIPIAGSDIEITVATTTVVGGVYTPGTYSPVSDLTTISNNSTRDKTATGVFMRTTKHTTFGPQDLSFTLSGLLSVGDSGQDILRTARDTNAVVSLKVLWDGTNGFTVLARVGGGTGNLTPEGLAETSFEISAEDAPAEVGDGPVW